MWWWWGLSLLFCHQSDSSSKDFRELVQLMAIPSLGTAQFWHSSQVSYPYITYKTSPTSRWSKGELWHVLDHWESTVKNKHAFWSPNWSGDELFGLLKINWNNSVKSAFGHKSYKSAFENKDIKWLTCFRNGLQKSFVCRLLTMKWLQSC